MHGSSSGCMNQQQRQGSRNWNGNSWRKQSAALCQLKWLQVSALHLKFVSLYFFFRRINPHVSVGWWRRPNFLEEGEMREHMFVLDQMNEGKDTAEWLPKKKKTLRRSVEQIRHCCVTSTLDVLEIQNTSGGRKTPGLKQVKCYFVLKTWVYVDGIPPGNSALHLTVLYYRYLTECSSYLPELMYLLVQTTSVPLQSGTKHCWSCCLLFSLSGIFLPNSISIPQWQLS